MLSVIELTQLCVLSWINYDNFTKMFSSRWLF